MAVDISETKTGPYISTSGVHEPEVDSGDVHVDFCRTFSGAKKIFSTVQHHEKRAI